jgi:hypothetical protein
MRVDKFFGAVVAASVALTPVAASAAQPVGSILSVKGDAFVSHEGRLVRAQPSMKVAAGDRVITRDGATASVGLNNCSVNVAGGQMSTVSNGSCGSVQTASFDRAASTGQNGSSLVAGGGFIIAILAAAAVIVGIVVVASNDDDTPTSP